MPISFFKQTPTKDLPARKSQAGAIFKFSAVFVLVFFGFLYYLKVSDNQAYLIDRNFRLLTVWSQQITGKLDSYLTAVDFIAQTIPTEEDQSTSTLPYRLKTGFEIKGKTLSPRNRNRTKASRFKAAREQVSKDLQALTFLNNVQVEALEDPPSSSRKVSETNESVSPRQRGRPGDHLWHVVYTDPKRKTQITAQIPIEGLVSEVADQTGKVFDDVLLANAEGMIVYQRQATEFRFTDLKALYAAQEKNDWLTAWFSGSEDEKTTSRATSEHSRSGHVQGIISPAHIQIAPGGTSHELFVQPVMIPNSVHGESNVDEGANIWFLCGVLSTASFRQEYLAIPFTYLLLFAFVLVTILLGLPFLSLALMDTRERLTRFSVFSLLLTAFLWSTTLTFFVLDVSMFQATKQRITDQLQTTARAIHNGFQIELDRILWQLKQFDNKITALKDIENISNPKPGQVAWVARTEVPDPCKPQADHESLLCFPYYSTMFWTDEQGDLRVNWTPRKDPYILGVHPLRHRDYVSVIQDQTRPLVTRRVGKWTIPFYVQPLITLESSERTLVVSKPHEPLTPGTTPWVAAIQPEIISLLKTPALPSGTGYAVIHQDNGKVLFHSEAERSFRENFFEETDMNETLQALVYSGTADSFEGEYWGRGHQFYVMPIRDLPWSLVVYQDKQLLRALNFSILLLAGFLFFLYFLVLILFFGLIVWLAGRQARKRWRGWIWPNSQFRIHYRSIAIWNLTVFIGVSLTLLWFDLPSGYEYLISVAAAPLSLLLLIGGLWAFGAGSSQQPSSTYPHRGAVLFSYGSEGKLNGLYSWMMFSYLLVFSILPASIIYSIAHREETDLLMKYNLFTLGQSLLTTQQPPLIAQGQVGDTGTFHYVPKEAGSTTSLQTPLIQDCKNFPPSQDSKDVMKKFSSRSLFSSLLSNAQPSPTPVNYILNGILKDILIPTEICFGELHSPVTHHHQAHIFIPRVHKLIRSTSLQSSPILQTWGFIEDGTRQHSFTWNIDQAMGTRRIALMMKFFPQTEQANAESTSSGTLILSAFSPFSMWMLPLNSPGWWISILVLVLLLCLLIRFSVQRIFPLRSCMPTWDRAHLSEKPPKIKTPRNFLIISPPGTGKSAFTQSQLQRWEIIDLHRIGQGEQWAESTLKALKNAKNVKPIVAIDHFEHQLGHPQHDREKRKLVEGLLMGGHHVCIFSNINPFLHALASLPTAQSDPPQSETFDSTPDWGFIFQSFLLLYFSDPGTPQLIQETLVQQSEPTLPSQLSDLNPIVQVFQTECGPTAHLRSVGKWIRQRTEWIAWSPDQLVANVLRLGKPYYHALWKSCSVEEKIALFHIAQDGFVHAGQPELPILHQKGLIRFTPHVQVMNDSFCRYIVIASHRENLPALEQIQTPNTWARLKWPLLFGVGLIILFLFATQQDFKDSLIALLSLLPVLLPALPELPGFLSASKLNESAEL